ncbi:MAG: SCO family protein, partial [Verrucomicrobia bacterium]|nr:SCO family protein [Verrucomicrobiota bacterium]
MRTLAKWISWFTATGLVVAAVSCRDHNSPPPPVPSAPKTNAYFVKGEIKEVKANESQLIVKHEAIPGYMMAMTMPFDVRAPQVLGALQAGDKISFRMLVTDTDGWIDQIKVLERPGPPPPPAPPEPRFRRVREVPPLNIGDALPDYPLTNELGQAVSLGQFKGEAVGFTFIFTRCPFPNFCPRMAENFLAAHRQLAAMTNGPTNWRLLSISFDPEFDTPAILKNYAARYPRDPQRWSYLTGALIEIDALTEQFGLYFSR